MVHFSLSPRFSFSSTTSSSPSSTNSSSPSSSTISSRSRINAPRPSSPAPKSPPTTALSILNDLSNSAEPFQLRRKRKRPKVSDGYHHYTSFSDLLSIPPVVLNRELEQSERERKQRERDQVSEETRWTAPPTPDPYFLPRLNHNRSLSQPPSDVSTFAESPTFRASPTRPTLSRTQTDPGYGSSVRSSNEGFTPRST